MRASLWSARVAAARGGPAPTPLRALEPWRGTRCLAHWRSEATSASDALRAGVMVAAAAAARTAARNRCTSTLARASADVAQTGVLAEEVQYVVMYTRAGCRYCSRAKALLRSRGVEFAVVHVDVEPERRQEATELSGSNTLPQIFVGRRCLGGFDDIKALDEANALRTALSVLKGDGPPITPTPVELLTNGLFLPVDVCAQLAPRVDALRKLQYSPGSSPSLRAFFRYAVTGKPVQDQSKNVPLNLTVANRDALPPAALPSMDATELGALIRQAMLQLLEEFVDPSTGDVDYVRMKSSRQWDLFRALTAELGDDRLRSDLLAMPEPSRKAFLINLYNVMTFHGIVTYGRRSGLWFLYCFFIAPAVSYRLAGAVVSLDDVENGLLRAQPGYFEAPGQELQQQLRMPRVDPRIHMALNCGARGCPAVAVYNGAALDSELDDAVVAFLSADQNVRVQATSGGGIHLALTSLLKMYIEDFAGSGAKADTAETRANLIQWLLPYLRGKKKELLAAVGSQGAANVSLEWLPYDWSTNGPELELDWRIYRPTW